MRLLIKALKGAHIVWYTPDQDFGYRHAVFVPFFGIPAATITTPTRLARVNGSAVMMVHFNRIGDSEQYRMLLTPPFEDYPSGDDAADAARVNLQLEQLIRRAPTQYMWYHRRFKTPIPGTEPPYPPKRKDVIRRRQQAAAAARAAAQDEAGRK